MYELYLHLHASKLAIRAARIQRRASARPGRHTFGLRELLAGLERLATLRLSLDAPTSSTARRDPREPANW